MLASPDSRHREHKTLHEIGMLRDPAQLFNRAKQAEWQKDKTARKALAENTAAEALLMLNVPVIAPPSIANPTPKSNPKTTSSATNVYSSLTPQTSSNIASPVSKPKQIQRSIYNKDDCQTKSHLKLKADQNAHLL
jgi:hypothetical protein